MEQETRVRLGARQTSKGGIQLDITSEAQTVDAAIKQLEEAIPKYKEVLHQQGLKTTDEES